MDDGNALEMPVNSTRQFNTVLGATIAVAIVFLFVSAVLTNAVLDIISEEDQNVGVRVPVWERSTQAYETSGEFGMVLETGQ